jgi:hypothetical protein
MGSMTALSHHQATFSYYPDNVGQPRTPETWSDMSWAALRVAAACLAFPAEPPQHWSPPAVAFAERTVAAWPVVTVGFMIMPAGTERSAARPHPSQHSPHLCLSLLSYGRDSLLSMGGTQDFLSLATDVLGSARRFGSATYPRSAMSLRMGRASMHENTAILLPAEQLESR